MKSYRVKNWNEIFETAETRKLENLRWVPTPNKHDGLGFRSIMAERDRSDLFSAWNLILQIASKGRRGERGKLARDGRPLTAKDMAIMTGFPEASFSRALSFFSIEVQWLEVEDYRENSATAADPASNPGESPARPADSPDSPASPPAEWKEGKEMNGSEGKRRSATSPSAPELPGGLASAEGFADEFAAFVAHRAKLKKPMTDHAKALLLAKLAQRPSDAIAALSMSIENGWQGVEWDWFDKRRGGAPARTVPLRSDERPPILGEEAA